MVLSCIRLRPLVIITIVFHHRKAQAPAIWHVALVLAAVMTIGATAVPRLLASVAAADRQSAISAIMTLSIAEQQYRKNYPSIGFASAMARLGSPRKGPCSPSSEQACLIGYDLAHADLAPLGGYRFTVSASKDTFVAAALPARAIDRTYPIFCVTEDQRYRVADPQTYASVAEPTHDVCERFAPLP